MKALIKYITNNALYRIASANSMAMLIKLFLGFITSKILVFYVGAEGIALFGNFRDFMSSAQAFSTLGLYNGLVKYVSEFKTKIKQLTHMLSTIFYIWIASTFLVIMIILLKADWFSLKLFNTNIYASELKLFALTLPLFALNYFFTGILNGYKRFKLLIILNISGHFLGAVLLITLVYFNNLKGALTALAISEASVVFITLGVLFYDRRFVKLLKFKNIRFKVLKKILPFSLMALLSALLIPLITLFVRDYITDHVSLEAAGFWEAMNRISRYYLMFVTSLLSLYILPKFAEINSNSAFKKEVFSFYKLIMPLFILGLVIIYFLRSYIVVILYNNTFQPVEDLFFWQLLGDLFKVMSLVLSFQFLAKRMFWEYVITEILSVGCLYFASMYFVNHFGVEGANMAHCVNYIFYFVLVVFVFRKTLF